MLNRLANYIVNQRRHTEVEVLYNDDPIMATVGSTHFRGSGPYGTYERSVDFLIPVADFDTPPKDGDIFQYNGRVYTVLSYNNEPSVRFSDPTELTYRIHTKETGDASNTGDHPGNDDNSGE